MLSSDLLFRPGIGVLVRHGAFWYPARLLLSIGRQTHRQWRVRFWRGCDFVKPPPESWEMTIEEEDIRDELWGDREARRQIRVRTYLVSFSISTMFTLNHSLDAGNKHFSWKTKTIASLMPTHDIHIRVKLLAS